MLFDYCHLKNQNQLSLYFNSNYLLKVYFQALNLHDRYYLNANKQLLQESSIIIKLSKIYLRVIFLIIHFIIDIN